MHYFKFTLSLSLSTNIYILFYVSFTLINRNVLIVFEIAYFTVGSYCTIFDLKLTLRLLKG